MSGAGSKLTDVSLARGMTFASDVPGFMRVSFLRNGGAILHVLATSDAHALCEPGKGTVEQCMQEGLDAFGTIYALRLN